MQFEGGPGRVAATLGRRLPTVPQLTTMSAGAESPGSGMTSRRITGAAASPSPKRGPTLEAKLQERIVRAERPQAGRPQAEGGWTFLSNYAHVLLLIAANPETRMRDLAERVGITERAIHRIVDDLAVAGYLRIFKLGRRNRYEVQAEMRLRHPAESHRCIGDLIKFVAMRPRAVSAPRSMSMDVERQA